MCEMKKEEEDEGGCDGERNMPNNYLATRLECYL